MADCVCRCTRRPNAYNLSSDKDIGKSRSSLQAWKSPQRRTITWHQLTSGGSGKVADLSDYKSVRASARQKGGDRVKHEMGCGHRSSVFLDSRRPNEKINIKVFELGQRPLSTSEDIGPGSYKVKWDTDIGHSRSSLQAWRQPERRTRWWLRETAEPNDPFQYNVHSRASRNRVGGRDSVLWPLWEDELGNTYSSREAASSRPPTSAGSPGRPGTRLSRQGWAGQSAASTHASRKRLNTA